MLWILGENTFQFGYPTNHLHYEIMTIHVSVFLVSLYGTPLAQSTSYLALHSSLFGPEGAVNYDYIFTKRINSLLIGSRCIYNGADTSNY